LVNKKNQDFCVPLHLGLEYLFNLRTQKYIFILLCTAICVVFGCRPPMSSSGGANDGSFFRSDLDSLVESAKTGATDLASVDSVVAEMSAVAKKRAQSALDVIDSIKAAKGIVDEDNTVSDKVATADTLANDTVQKDTLVAFHAEDYTEERIREMRMKGESFTDYTDTTKVDTTRMDTLPRSKGALESPVEFEASDSVTFDYAHSHAYLYGDSKVHYQNLDLTADVITMSMDSSIVHAAGRIDTTDNKNTWKGKPVFKQGNEEYEPDSISYNFKTRKAFIRNVYTDQGQEGGIMHSDMSKRDSSGVMYIEGGEYTTCEADHPHFYFKMSRAKVRPGEDVVFGPTYLVVEDVPLPLAVPYGFFPFSQSYSSGFIMPTYGDETNRGFYLRDGGYYLAISDKIDMKLLGEIYTKGSWGISVNTNYKKRYKFNGNLMFSYQNTKEGEKNMPDYSVSKSFKFTWRHSQDSKANPSSSFSASVNFATSSYERNNLTSMYNPESLTQSTRTSSISYSKTFSNIGLTLSGTFNLSQNMRDSTLSVTLPTLNISLARFYPFKRKKAVGAERWYEKIAMSYTGTLSNSITAKENVFFQQSLIKDWKNAMRHQIPVSASFTVAKYINLTPSFNFTDRTYSNKIMKSWDQQNQRELNDTVYGFYNVYNYNLAVSANTKLYGMYKLMPLKRDANGKVMHDKETGKAMRYDKIQVRHVLTPSVSFSYAPDFSASRYGFYETYVKTDKDGNVSTEPVSYSPYSSGMYGTVSKGKTGSVSFDLGNNLEMKYLGKDKLGNDTLKKISLIDELGANLSYNMAAQKKPWSDLSMRVRLKLTKSYTFSMNAVFATYAYELDDNGKVFLSDHTEWSHGRFGRFQGMSQNFSYTFNNDTFKKLFGGGDSDTKKGRGRNDEEDAEDEEETDPEMQNVDPDRAKAKSGAKQTSEGEDADGYMKYTLPWSFSVSYGVSMRENTSADINTKSMRYPYKLTHTLNFSGNIRIAEGWNINFSSGWDFNMKKLSMTTASLSRDLHCFSMSCSMVIAPYRSYNFTFACNASTLADALKWKKQSSYGSNIEWY